MRLSKPAETMTNSERGDRGLELLVPDTQHVRVAGPAVQVHVDVRAPRLALAPAMMRTRRSAVSGRGAPLEDGGTT